MGKITKTVTEILREEEQKLGKFRRALRREDQIVFDDLFVAAYKHRAASSYAGHLLPFESFLLSMQVEDHKKVMRIDEMEHGITRLRAEVANVRKEVVSLRREVATLRRLVKHD